MDNENLGTDFQGKIEISPEVIEVIAAIATSEVEGVATLRGTFASDFVERFGRKSHRKGVKVTLTEEGIVLDISVIIQYGYSIPTVGHEIQSNIKQELQNMTALDAKEINIRIAGIQFEQPSDNVVSSTD